MFAWLTVNFLSMSERRACFNPLQHCRGVFAGYLPTYLPACLQCVGVLKDGGLSTTAFA